MTKKISAIIFVLLLGGLIFSIANTTKKPNGQQDNSQLDSSPQNFSSNKILELPVALDNSQVGNVYLHYFFHGKINELKKVPEGTQIVLEGDNRKLPNIIITKETRISKISPPYSAQTAKLVSQNTLKTGMYVDVSMEQDLRSKAWLTHDIFIPTDKN